MNPLAEVRMLCHAMLGWLAIRKFVTMDEPRPRLRMGVKRQILTGWALAGLLCAAAAGGSGCTRRFAEPFDVGAELQAAVLALDAQRFEEAKSRYQRVWPHFPKGSPFWAEVTYGYGLALWHNPTATVTDQLAAERLFIELSKTEPGGAFAIAARLARARLLMCWVAAGNSFFDGEAMRLLESLLQDAPEPTRHEAALRLAELHLLHHSDEQRLAKAVELLSDWLQRYPGNPLAAQMIVTLGHTLAAQRLDLDAAVDVWLDLLELNLNDLNDPAQVLWIAGTVALQRERSAEAGQFFARLVDQYALSPWSPEAARWLLLLP